MKNLILFFCALSASLALGSAALASSSQDVNLKGDQSQHQTFIDWKEANYEDSQTIQCDDFYLKNAKITVMGKVDKDFRLFIEHSLEVQSIKLIKVNGQDATEIFLNNVQGAGSVRMERFSSPPQSATVTFDEAC